MENAWKELQPKNIYQGRKTFPLTEEGQQALLYLYQPLIGGEALSLYFTLLSEISKETGIGSEALHADLLSGLDCGLPQFYEARKKLEGIGLLDVYFKEDPSLGPCFLYELLEPLAPDAFFKDAVLSFMLLEKIGERRWNQLNEKFQFKRFSSEGYQKVTKKFLDVFRFNEASFEADKEKIEQSQSAFEKEKTPTLIDDAIQVDWPFLSNLLQKKHITSLEKPVIEQIELYHRLYGFDELTLGELIASAYDFTQQTVSLKDLQKQIVYRQKTVKKEEVPETTAAQQLPAKNDAASALIADSKNNPPMQYLEAVKNAKGGFVSKEEKWLMQDLVKQSKLPNSVINVLINYVLVIKNQASLKSNYVNTIANEWQQANIRTPEEAVEHVRKLSEPKPKTAKTTYGTAKRNVRREKLPDWVNKPEEEKQISSEKQAEIDRRFKEYLAKKEGDN